MRQKWDNTVKGPHKLSVSVQTHVIVIVRMIASCMAKVASGFPAHGACICSDSACCVRSQGSQAEFPPSSSLFCNLSCFSLGWHWTGAVQEVLPGQSEPPEIRGWKIIIWIQYIIEKSFSVLVSWLQFLSCPISLLPLSFSAFCFLSCYPPAHAHRCAL